MPHRPPRPLAAASAVLLAAVVGLWVRYWRADSLAVWIASGESWDPKARI